MSLALINVGQQANDGTGDTPRAAGMKTNANFQAIEAALVAAGISLQSGPGPYPNPTEFKIALMNDLLFLQWQEDIPAIRREDLKLALLTDKWPVAQAIYDSLKAMILAPEGATAQWQSIADEHIIPLVF